MFSPLELREALRAGKSPMREAQGEALPVKQHPECNLAMTLPEERHQPVGSRGQLLVGKSDTRSPGPHCLTFFVSLDLLVVQFVVAGSLVEIG